MLPLLVTLWIVGLCFCSIRLLGGLAVVARVKRHHTAPASHEWQQRLAALARRMRVRGRDAISLRVCANIRTAAVIGWLRPVILVPASALTGLAPHQMEAVLAHELAHIRRHDYLVNLLQSVVETLFFYHPAVWYLSRRVRLERENCCDDDAVAVVGDPVTYAGALTDLEMLRQGAPALAMAANGGSLLRRVERLLAPRSEAASSWSTATGLLTLVVVFAVLATAHGSIAAGLQPESTGASRTRPRSTTTASGRRRLHRRRRRCRSRRAGEYPPAEPPDIPHGTGGSGRLSRRRPVAPVPPPAFAGTASRSGALGRAAASAAGSAGSARRSRITVCARHHGRAAGSSRPRASRVRRDARTAGPGRGSGRVPRDAVPPAPRASCDAASAAGAASAARSSRRARGRRLTAEAPPAAAAPNRRGPRQPSSACATPAQRRSAGRSRERPERQERLERPDTWNAWITWDARKPGTPERQARRERRGTPSAPSPPPAPRPPAPPSEGGIERAMNWIGSWFDFPEGNRWTIRDGNRTLLGPLPRRNRHHG